MNIANMKTMPIISINKINRHNERLSLKDLDWLIKSCHESYHDIIMGWFENARKSKNISDSVKEVRDKVESFKHIYRNVSELKITPTEFMREDNIKMSSLTEDRERWIISFENNDMLYIWDFKNNVWKNDVRLDLYKCSMNYAEAISLLKTVRVTNIL